ncbi:MAG: GspE/PulE family protein [Sumerlaeia bacterium]
MGLFSRDKNKKISKEELEEPETDLNAAVEGVDPLANFKDEAAAKPSRPKPTQSQKDYFRQINQEKARKPGGSEGMSQLKRILEETGLVPSEVINETIAREGEAAAAVRQSLINKGYLQEEDFMLALSEGLGMEKADFSTLEVTDDLVRQISKKHAMDYRVFPMRYDDEEIEVALADPMNIQITDDLERILKKRIIPLIAREDEINRYIKRFYEGDEIANIYQGMTDDLHDEESKKKEMQMMGEMELSSDEANVPAVVKFVDLIFKQAVHDRASDIHIEPEKNHVAIRFRIDGVCQEVPSPPKRWQNAIISRLKVLSNMDLAEKRIPQDGRIKLNLPDKKLDLRVSLLPAIHGESIVMRILDQSSVILGLEDVGFLPDNIRIFNELIRTPTGVILMTGPTGSGKTTTLYSALSVLNTAETKIITIENPVEYMLDGVNQVQTNEEIGLDFKTGLRSMLRQSPDVILVGEIRDLETAEIAVRAALTGHLVFSTLHTNDAPSATSRLSDMGVKPFLVASSIQAVIAQRLLRRLCIHCKRMEHMDITAVEGVGPTDEELENGIDAYLPTGCDRCSGSGYKGRTAIHEIFVMDSKLRQLVIQGEASSRLKKLAVRRGMRTLRMDGFRKVVLGHTSLEELNRVTAAD